MSGALNYKWDQYARLQARITNESPQYKAIRKAWYSGASVLCGAWIAASEPDVSQAAADNLRNMLEREIESFLRSDYAETNPNKPPITDKEVRKHKATAVKNKLAVEASGYSEESCIITLQSYENTSDIAVAIFRTLCRAGLSNQEALITTHLAHRDLMLSFRAIGEGAKRS